MAKLTIENLPLDRELDRDAMREIVGGGRRLGHEHLAGASGANMLGSVRGGAGDRFGRKRGSRFRRS